MVSDFIRSSEAFRAARERASVAAAFEANLLHVAVLHAREAGMSVRGAANALSVPKSTVARHWRENHQCPSVLPVWGSDTAWRDAHAAIWAHSPPERADEWVPYEWHHGANSITVTHKSRGTMQIRGDGTADVTWAEGGQPPTEPGE